MDGQAKTPMRDHIVRFWRLLANEHVRILIEIRRDHDEGQPPHWDSSSFGNDVAKAIVEHNQDRILELSRLSHHWMKKHDELLGFIQARPKVLAELIADAKPHPQSSALRTPL